MRTNIHIKKSVFTLLMVVLFLLTGCKNQPTAPDNDEQNPDPPIGNPTQSDILEEAWVLYANQTYNQAIGKFQEVLASDTLQGEANCGLAWSYARMDSLSDSYAFANSAIQQEYMEPDIYLLQGAILMTHQEYDSVLTTLKQIKTQSPSWIFPRDNNVNYHDILLLKAYAQFYLGEFNNVSQIIHDLDDSLSFDASSDGPWTYESRQYERFEDLLLAVLNDFTGLIVVG